MSFDWTGSLARSGLAVTPLDPAHVELSRGSLRAVFSLVVSARQLSPSQLPPLLEPPALLVVPSATPATRNVARRRGWSLVADDGSGWIAFPGALTVELIAEPARTPRAARSPGRTPWGRLTLLRRLLELGPVKQAELARLAGVSQARVSQVLAPFARSGLVARDVTGWVVTDWDAVCDRWIEAYQGPGGIATHWYGLADPTAQALSVAGLLGRSAEAVVSGDVAADLAMPWRRPVHAVVYAKHGKDLAAAGLTAATPDEATLRLVIPADPGVWPVRRWTRATARQDELALADPLQVLVDLQQAPGADAADAADRWREGLRDGRIGVNA